MPHTPVAHTSASLPFEPFRVKVVEPIRPTTVAQRRQMLQAANDDVFRIPADAVMIDLLTDSGTGAMSSAQWSAMMRGDDRYAGSTSYHRLVERVEQVIGINNVLPVHQGRVAERLLVETVIGQSGRGMIVPNNAHFDTTRFMIESSGAEARNLLNNRGVDMDDPSDFKGDMDLNALEGLLNAHADRVPMVLLTVTCNSNGGQGVSLANMQAVRNLCDAFRKPLILDACRFAENAYIIQQREAGQAARSIAQIVRDMFDLCDGAAMSARKDCLCNVGGMLVLRDQTLFERAASRCVLTQGFTMNYGSLPGRDLEAMAVGLMEATEPTYLAQRALAIADLANTLERGGVKIVRPEGGHAVFIDAADFCPQLRQGAAQALACAIYEHTGVRATAIGSTLVNRRTGRAAELTRLAIPRRTYSPAHLQYVAHSIVELRHGSHRIGSRIETETADPEIRTRRLHAPAVMS